MTDEAPPEIIDDWLTLYDRRAADLTRFATLLVGGADADDVVSDAMIAVLRAAADHTIAPSATYLYRAVSNTAKNHLRARDRRRHHEDRAARTVAPSDADGREPDRADIDLRPLLGELSDRQREIVFLTYWLDLRPADVADHLDVAEGTVRSQLARARRILRGALDD